MDSLKQEIFDDVTFSDLLKEIHGNSKKKSKQINNLINQLKPMIHGLGDAVTVIPLIKEYMELGIKNDDALIKMAGIVQRASGGSISSDGGTLTEDEMNQLQELAEIASEKPKQITESNGDSPQ